jgi:UDP-N-acetylmuramoylalanine-D-glutamate ligase
MMKNENDNDINLKNEKEEFMKVVIIGGGIGGLACAYALQSVGVNVIVYERDRNLTVRKQGNPPKYIIWSTYSFGVMSNFNAFAIKFR